VTSARKDKITSGSRRPSNKPAHTPLPEPRTLDVSSLIKDLGAMIDGSRRQLAVATNAALTTLYWQLGRRVHTNVLDGQARTTVLRLSPRWGGN